MKFCTLTRGSVALISILIISAFTLILAVGMSEINTFTAYQWANNVTNKKSYYNAEACLEETMKRLKSDINFAAATLTFGTDESCTVAVNGNLTKQITITTTYDDSTQQYAAQVQITQMGTANNIRLLSWSKI